MSGETNAYKYGSSHKSIHSFSDFLSFAFLIKFSKNVRTYFPELYMETHNPKISSKHLGVELIKA